MEEHIHKMRHWIGRGISGAPAGGRLPVAKFWLKGGGWVDEMTIDKCLAIPRVLARMDSDVWKSELSVFVSAKNVNIDIRIHF
jgi:hypothetical protein